jgi:hypothetical protein
VTNRRMRPNPVAASRRLCRELYAFGVTTATLAACGTLNALKVIQFGWLARDRATAPARMSTRAPAASSYVDFAAYGDPSRALRERHR